MLSSGADVPEYEDEFQQDQHAGALIAEDDTGKEHLVYKPQEYQLPFHSSNAPNLLALGTRGTGKSLMIRMDAILRCLMIPHFRALIIRRTMPELRNSHLAYIEREMELLGGTFLRGVSTAEFPNGSTIVFRHCETEADILNFLSSEYGAIYFDELSTFTLNQFLQISAAARAPTNAGYQAIVRAGSNPLGVGAEWMEQWFVTKKVRIEDYPNYHPDDFEMQFSTLQQNVHLDRVAYEARLKNLPEHVRKAWLLGEFVMEGAYFSDFHKVVTDTGEPWHVIDSVPTMIDPADGVRKSITQIPWIKIYRAIDWGYFPDPAVCLWIATLPNKRAFVFKERQWLRTNAAVVAQDIKQASNGMHIVESFCDPTMMIKEGQVFSIGDIFETNGVPVTPGVNDRILYGYSVHEYLNEIIDEKPKIQILKGVNESYGCSNLIRTFGQLRMDKTDPRKIADGEDHWVVALAYFCMGGAQPSQNPARPSIPRWMQPRRAPRMLAA